MSTVIVFGATGAVGSAAAITAAERGAKVFLAMRDTKKDIQGLSKEQEEKGHFQRVTADLTKPDTVSSAVKESGAKRAFIYLAHGADMKPTIEALKTAGIELVVFLSSFTVKDPPSQYQDPKNIIPYVHAVVEVYLQDIFGPKGYVALRPATFASNAEPWYSAGFKSGHVEILGPNILFDMIVPYDIGSVAGSVLANGQKDGESHIDIYGPQLLEQEKAIEIIKKVVNKPDVKVTSIDKKTYIDIATKAGIPPPIAEHLGNKLEEYATGKDSASDGQKVGAANVERYIGRPGTTFEKWVEQNKAIFQ